MSTVETPVTHDVAVQQFIDQLTAMRASIDGIVFLPPEVVRRLNPSAKIPDAFLEAVAVAVTEAAVLAGSSLLSAKEYRDAIAFSLAWDASRRRSKRSLAASAT